MHPEVMRYNLKKLERAGALESRKEKNRAVYSLVPE